MRSQESDNFLSVSRAAAAAVKMSRSAVYEACQQKRLTHYQVDLVFGYPLICVIVFRVAGAADK